MKLKGAIEKETDSETAIVGRGKEEREGGREGGERVTLQAYETMTSLNRLFLSGVEKYGSFIEVC